MRRFYRIGKLKQKDRNISVQIKQNKSVIAEKNKKNKDRKTVQEKIF